MVAENWSQHDALPAACRSQGGGWESLTLCRVLPRDDDGASRSVNSMWRGTCTIGS